LSDWASAMLNKPAAAKPAAPVENADQAISQRFAALLGDETGDKASEPPQIMTSGLTDLFGTPDEDEVPELASLFGDEPPAAAEDDGSDPMAWLREAGVEIVGDDESESPTFASLFDDDDDLIIPVEEENPLAWMGDESGSLVIEDAAEPESAQDDDAVLAASDDNDSLAWLRDSAAIV